MGNAITKENTSGIKKVQTYQNITTVKKLDMSRKTSRRDSGKKIKNNKSTENKKKFNYCKMNNHKENNSN